MRSEDTGFASEGSETLQSPRRRSLRRGRRGEASRWRRSVSGVRRGSIRRCSRPSTNRTRPGLGPFPAPPGCAQGARSGAATQAPTATGSSRPRHSRERAAKLGDVSRPSARSSWSARPERNVRSARTSLPGGCYADAWARTKAPRPVRQTVALAGRPAGHPTAAPPGSTSAAALGL